MRLCVLHKSIERLKSYLARCRANKISHMAACGDVLRYTTASTAPRMLAPPSFANRRSADFLPPAWVRQAELETTNTSEKEGPRPSHTDLVARGLTLL
jgi:hypothetical protein